MQDHDLTHRPPRRARTRCARLLVLLLLVGASLPAAAPTANAGTTVPLTNGRQTINIVSAGNADSIELRADGTVWQQGVLPDNTTTSTPVQVLTAAATPLTNVVQASSGGDGGIALKSDGTVWVWSKNNRGQLANGTINVPTFSNYAVQVKTGGATFLQNVVQVDGHNSAGFAALKADGTVWAWGGNTEGELGDGTQVDKAYAQQVNASAGVPMRDVKQIDASGNNLAMLKSDGTVWTVGRNANGELGNGGVGARQLYPVQALTAAATPLTGVVKIAGTHFGHFALMGDHTAYAWGVNDFGQLSVGNSFTDKVYATQVLAAAATPLTDITDVSGGRYVGLFIRSVAGAAPAGSGGTVWAAGYNGWRLIGDGTSGTQRNYATQTMDTPGTYITNATSISAGWDFSMARTADGTVYGWGQNGNGQLGMGDTVERAYATPNNFAPEAGGYGYSGTAAGTNHALTIRSDGTVWAWGTNTSGQLGNGTTAIAGAMVEVLTGPGTPLTNVVEVAAGASHSLALRADGSVWAWGSNATGQLGQGNTTQSSYAVQVLVGAGTPLQNAFEIGAGGGHSAALLTTKGAAAAGGTLWGWGDNGVGQVGDGTTTQRLYATQGKTAAAAWVTAAIGVSLGVNNTAILSSLNGAAPAGNSGTVWMSGDNTFNSIGDGTVVQRNYITQSKTAAATYVTSATHVAVGDFSTIVVRTIAGAAPAASGGTVWGWGWNNSGEIGDGTTTQRAYATQSKTAAATYITDAYEIDIAKNDGVALRTTAGGAPAGSSNTVWTWGSNTTGQFSDGSTTGSNYPVQAKVNAGTYVTNATSVSEGGFTTVHGSFGGSTPLNSGQNAGYQLGDCTTTQRLYRVQVLTKCLQVTGTAYEADGTTPWAGCGTYNVAMSVNGAAKTTTPCTAGTGAFTFPFMQPSALDAPLIVFLDDNVANANDGVTYTRNGTLSGVYGGIPVVRNRVQLSSQTGTALTNADINVFDNTQDPDIPAISTGTDLTTASSTEVYVDTGAEYGPGGNVTAASLDLRGTFTGSDWASLTLTGSGTGGCNGGPGVQRPLCISGGTFRAAPYGTTNFTGTAASDIEGTTYHDLSLAPSGAGSPTYNLGAGSATTVASGSVTIGDGTNPVTVSTTANNAATTVRGNLAVSANAALAGAGSGTTTVRGSTTGAGTVSLTAGTFEQRSNDTTTTLGSTSGSNSFGFGTLAATNGMNWGNVASGACQLQAGIDCYTTAGANQDVMWRTAVGPDGSLYVAGFATTGATGTDAVVRKYTPDGALDTTWNAGQQNGGCSAAPPQGTLCYSSPGANGDAALGIAVAPDGSLFVTGYDGNALTSQDIFVRKYTPAGVLDTTWNAGSQNTGCYTAPSPGATCYSGYGGQSDAAFAITLGADGSVFVGGYATTGQTAQDFVILKYTPTGLVDTSWNAGRQNDGCTKQPIQGMTCYSTTGAQNDVVRAMTMTADGSVIAVGEAVTGAGAADFVARKYTPAGVLDTTFNAGGVNAGCTSAPPPGMICVNGAGNNNDAARGVSVASDGSVFIAGYVYSGAATSMDAVIRKYTAVGVLDTTWNAGQQNAGCPAAPPKGTVCYSSAGANVDTGYALQVSPAGEAYMIGYTNGGASGDNGMARRYTAAGVLDTTWNAAQQNLGCAAAPPQGSECYSTTGSNQDIFLGGSLGSDGSLYVTGQATTAASGVDAVMVKYTPTGAISTGATTVRASAGGTGTINPTALTVGSALDAANTTLDDETNDRVLDVDGNVFISAKGVLTASSTALFTVAGNFQRLGTFTPGTGTVTFDDASKVSTLSYTAATTFAGFTVATPNKTLKFDSVNQTNVTGALNVSGLTCSTQAQLVSDTGGVAWKLNATGAKTVNYAYISDSTAVTTATANNSFGGTGNSGWTINAGTCATALSMYADDVNASAGSTNNTSISQTSHHYSWINRAGATVDRQRVQVVNDPLDNVVALWHLDGNGTDASGGAHTQVLGGAPNNQTWAAGATNFGQSIQFDGSNDYSSAAANAAFNIGSDFTVDVWFKTTAYGGGAGNSVLIQKTDTTGCGANCNFDIEFDETNNKLVAGIYAGGAIHFVGMPNGTAPTLLDGNWHYAALTYDSSFTARLYVDGALAAGPSNFGAAAVTTNQPVSIGAKSNGTTPYFGNLDDARLLSRALSATEIAGYYKTALPHNTTMWDSDISDTGVALGADCLDAARCADIVYGATGAPAILRYNGARYYARAKYKTKVGSVWTTWGGWDWFETMQALTFSVSSGPTATFGAMLPNTDGTSTSDLSVYCNAPNGYLVTASGPADGWSMQSGANNVTPWTGTPATPTNWPAGAAGGFGVTVLSATGGKDTARWGTGTTQTSFGTLNYAGPLLSTPTMLHNTTSFDGLTDTVTVGYRLDTPPAQQPGAYSGTITYTATANP